MKIASALAKSSSSTVPLPMPMLSGRPTLVGSWHMLVHERRLVRGASRGVELGLVRVVESVQFAADQCERLIPSDRHIMVGRGIVAHRLGQTPLLFKPIVTFLFQFTDGMGCKEFACHAALGQLPADGLGAIFAKLE